MIELLEQIKDLVAVSRSIDNLATQESQEAGQVLESVGGGQGLGTKRKFAAMVQEEITRIQGLMQDKNEASEPGLVVPSEI
ncbi:hypothetical protein GGR52DRAFT_569150 [Hypoxylon sp. FL1284]|nr:hypothetical protein GGR52DRAFT_569150 [Hypoxylon sp. FL1284]